MKNIKLLISSILTSFLILSNTTMLSTYAKESNTTLKENSNAKPDIAAPIFDLSSLKILRLSYNSKTNLYECTIPINNDIAKGCWYIDRISLTDYASNTSCISGTSNDLSSLNFNVG